LIDKTLRQEDRESELRNAIRPSLGLAEKPVKWINLDEEGERLEPVWAVPFDDTATRMAMSPDGTLLAIVLSDGRIRIHRTPGGAVLGEIPKDDTGLANLEFCRRCMRTRFTVSPRF
jgi:hypothetical protein